MVEADLIRRIPRFAEISKEAVARLCERARIKKFSRGAFVFLEGDSCANFYLVVSGEIRIFKTLESGREIILGLARAGESIGEVALLDGDDFPATAAAQEVSTVLSLPRNDYLNLVERFPEVARATIRDLMLRLRALRLRVENLSEIGVQARIAVLLQTFGRELGRVEQGRLVVPVKLTRGEIAGMVGARVETVIRIMSRWRKKNLVTPHPEGFLVEKPEELVAIIGSQG